MATSQEDLARKGDASLSGKCEKTENMRKHEKKQKTREINKQTDNLNDSWIYLQMEEIQLTT